MFLLKYTTLNTEGYMLVYAANENKAIQKLEKHLEFLTQVYVTNATLS